MMSVLIKVELHSLGLLYALFVSRSKIPAAFNEKNLKNCI